MNAKLSLELLLPEGSATLDLDAPPPSTSAAAAAATAAGTSSSRRRARGADPLPPPPGEPSLQSEALLVDGAPARVKLSGSGLEWVCAAQERGCCLPAEAPRPPQWLPISEVLSLRALPPRLAGAQRCGRVKLHRLALLTFQRRAERRCEWAPRRLVLESPDHDALRDWAAAIAAGLDGVTGPRPRRLLVVLNPNAGRRQARYLWRRLVAPVFDAGGIKCELTETRGPGHAHELVAALTLGQLQALDGGWSHGGAQAVTRAARTRSALSAPRATQALWLWAATASSMKS